MALVSGSSKSLEKMGIDSEAFFSARLAEAGFDEKMIGDMKAKGWTTYGDFAFSTSYHPGMVDDTPFIQEVVIPILGDAGHPMKTRLRRILAEATTLAAAEQRKAVEVKKDGDLPRALPMPDRKARYDKQVAALTGLELTGQLECSNQLIDACVHIYESDVMQYLPWAECTSKSQELLGIKKDKFLLTDANGFVKSLEQDQKMFADLSTDLRVKYALTRRGLAFDQAHIMSYKVHDKVVQLYLKYYLKDPQLGFDRVSFDQILRADHELFRRMVEETRGGIKSLGGRRPLDALVPMIIVEADFRSNLQAFRSGTAPAKDHQFPPLPPPVNTAATQEAMRTRSQQSAKDKAKNAAKRDGERVKSEVPPPKVQKVGPGPGKPKMPESLRGMAHQTIAKKNICYGYNLGNCDKAQPGQKCVKGLHVCMRPGCEKPHSLKDNLCR